MRASAAYDLSRFAPEPRQQPQVRVVKTTNKKKKADKRRAVKARSVVFVVVLLLLMAGTVFSRMQLTETRAQINACAADLSEMESYNTYLNYELESKISLKDAEEFAVTELGLVKLSSNQISYVNLNEGNSIDLHSDEKGVFERIGDFFREVVSFFGGEVR